MTYEIETSRLFNDKNYRFLITEYHSFVAYILTEINNPCNYKIASSGVKFDKDSDLFYIKDEFIDMLKKTFPHFDVIFEKADECESKYKITVSWEKNLSYLTHYFKNIN